MVGSTLGSNKPRQGYIAGAMGKGEEVVEINHKQFLKIRCGGWSKTVAEYENDALTYFLNEVGECVFFCVRPM